MALLGRLAFARVSVPLRWRILAPSAAWLGFFFLLPLAILALSSLAERGPYGGIAWRFFSGNYARLLDPLYLSVIARSLVLASASTVLCAILAFPLSYWMARAPRKRQGLLLLLVLIPFWTNILVRLYAWMFILGRSGLLNSIGMALGLWSEPLEILFKPQAVLIGLVYGQLPFMVLPLYATLEKIDWSLVEAARDLYASSAQVFWRVLLPLSRPGLVAGSILVFVSVLGDFVAPDLLGGAKSLMVGNLIHQQYLVLRDWPFGSALSLLVMALIGGGIAVYLREEAERA